ncbi:probable receptor-like protein kinase At1g80640 isoform X2 [Punica granatum]|uniref:Probable receptor-like protein kinase At1g80640 isoform X2 n=1 Tax=Punica granatum TaxID=22663 RepID=A0A6P8BNF1_PUNGR|nr:probable receptor-like protein kinase At1g80640 isoform X2 [Punica granatum]
MSSGGKLVIALIVACSSLGAIMFFSVCFWIYHFRCRRRARTDTSSFSTESLEAQKGLYLTSISSKFGSLKAVTKKKSVPFIDYNLLEKATNNFDPAKKLGEGGFGCVYEGSLEDNTQVAVKKLNRGTKDVSREFEIEVKFLRRMQHPNIISLLGYSTNGQASFIVYELMQNGSLETQLHGPSLGSALTWHMRMKIALDTARGLEYLHEQCKPPVIHRDLKSANILLDSNFNAKLSDFGLAVTEGRRKIDKTDLSGTLGYVAPEYLLDGKLTDKSDVYAFGVVLLELLLGRRPMEKLAPSQCQSIVSWALPQLTDRSKLPNILDPSIKDKIDIKHLYQVAAVALLCLQPEPSYRPLIADVLHSLVPLVSIELGGTLDLSETVPSDHV